MTEHPARIVIRYGAGGAAIAFVATLVGVAVAIAVMTAGLAADPLVDAVSRTVFGIVAAADGATLVWAVVFLIRNPRVLTRAILVTGASVMMPTRGQGGVIPVNDIAGVGLLRQRGRNGSRAGRWGVAIWKGDGAVAFAPGLQRAAGVANPAQTKVATAARQLHAAVAQLQGPEGLLTRQALQRHATFKAYAPYTAAWDPVTAASVSN